MRNSTGLPRASGGVSEKFGGVVNHKKSSPREWGCFRGCRVKRYAFTVFPARVGVFPFDYIYQAVYSSLPRASGGVS